MTKMGGWLLESYFTEEKDLMFPLNLKINVIRIFNHLVVSFYIVKYKCTV